MTAKFITAIKKIGVARLSRELGVCRATIYRWIDGKNLPNSEHLGKSHYLKKIAELSGYDHKDLVDDYVKSLYKTISSAL